jgi:hypothetical protein
LLRPLTFAGHFTTETDLKIHQPETDGLNTGVRRDLKGDAPHQI